MPWFWNRDKTYMGQVDNSGKPYRHESSKQMAARRKAEKSQALKDKDWHENGGERTFYPGMASGYTQSEREQMAAAADWETARMQRATANNHIHKIRNGYVSFSYDLWRFWKDMGVDLYEVFYPGLFGKGAGEEKFRRAYQAAWQTTGTDPAEQGKCDFTYETEATKDWNVKSQGLLGTSHTTTDAPNYRRLASEFLDSRTDMEPKAIMREAGKRWHPDVMPRGREGQYTEFLQEISRQLNKRGK